MSADEDKKRGEVDVAGVLCDKAHGDGLADEELTSLSASDAFDKSRTRPQRLLIGEEDCVMDSSSILPCRAVLRFIGIIGTGVSLMAYAVDPPWNIRTTQT